MVHTIYTILFIYTILSTDTIASVYATWSIYTLSTIYAIYPTYPTYIICAIYSIYTTSTIYTIYTIGPYHPTYNTLTTITLSLTAITIALPNRNNYPQIAIIVLYPTDLRRLPSAWTFDILNFPLNPLYYLLFMSLPRHLRCLSIYIFGSTHHVRPTGKSYDGLGEIWNIY
jgi:hypothetical protein